MTTKSALVVDDTDLHRSAIRSLLVVFGFNVTTATDGMQAMKLLETAQFDLIFTDLEMPNMNGKEFLRRARRHRTASKTPIVMLSTVDSPDVREEALQLGANCYVLKPFTSQSINQAMKTVGY